MSAEINLAEVTESMSVYQYANNNPIMMNDPLGNYYPGKLKTLDSRADHYSGIPSDGYNYGGLASGGGGSSGMGGVPLDSGGGLFTIDILNNIFNNNPSGLKPLQLDNYYH